MNISAWLEFEWQYQKKNSARYHQGNCMLLFFLEKEEFIQKEITVFK